MTVELFNFSKRYNSTKAPTAGTGLTLSNVQIKEDCSIYNPILIFSVSAFSVPTMAPSFYNYATITKFQRSYFIEDWTYKGNVWEAQLSIDVLGTYKTSIGAVNTMIERSASAYDGNVVDTLYKRKVNTQITSVTMESSFMGVAPSAGCFIVGIVGYPPAVPSTTPNNLGSVNYYALSIANLKSLCEWMYSDNIWTDLNITDVSNGLFKSMFNPIQYLVSCIWFPFSADQFSSAEQANVWFGYWNTNIQGYPVNSFSITTDVRARIPEHPQIARGAYLNYAPYTKATAYIPGIGSVPIDTTFRAGGNYVRARFLIDTHTGLADVSVSLCQQSELPDTAGEKIFFFKSVMFGVPIQISQAMVAVMSGSGFSLGDLTSLAGNFVKGELLPTATDILGGGADYHGGYPSITSNGSNGSFNLVNLRPRLIVEHYRITDEDLTEFGRPLMQMRTINTLSGFVKCMDAHIDLPITDREKRDITSFLNSGFFYE